MATSTPKLEIQMRTEDWTGYHIKGPEFQLAGTTRRIMIRKQDPSVGSLGKSLHLILVIESLDEKRGSILGCSLVLF